MIIKACSGKEEVGQRLVFEMSVTPVTEYLLFCLCTKHIYWNCEFSRSPF